MIYIKKGNNTPKIFIYAKRNYQNYDNLPGDVKNKMKEILLSEQGTSVCILYDEGLSRKFNN